METQAPIPNVSSRSPKILFLFAGIVLATLFVAFNIWVYKQTTKGGSLFPKSAALPVGRPSLSKETLTNPPLNVDLIPPRPTSSPLPTPTPLQGPGTFACDPYGSCNHYANPEGIGCPKTFADSACLGQCGDKSNWCPN